MKKQLYYRLKPFIPKRTLILLRRGLVKLQRLPCADFWPIDEKAGVPPEKWQGWPENKRFALVLTHDVETIIGYEKCEKLMNLENKFGFKSSFNFVPKRYNVSSEVRNLLIKNGFEVGVHGLYHDGKLYNSKKIFLERAEKINHYLKKWSAAGFRSPSMHSNLKWLHALDIKYDASTFDTDPFEIQSGRLRTIFPYLVNNDLTQSSYVELPYTLPQDSTLFIYMEEDTIDIWKQKLDWIAKKGGMALMVTHPDYMYFGDGKPDMGEYPVKHYIEFLNYIKEHYKEQYWHVLPKSIAEFCEKNTSNIKKIVAREGRQETNILLNKSQKISRVNPTIFVPKEKHPGRGTIWIDLDNTPHVVFFRPIIKELEKRGYKVAISARKCFQTCGLADRFKMSYTQIGIHYGKSKLLKVLGLLIRSLMLIPFVIREKPIFALSHGSRSQLLTAKLLNIPSVLFFDYEYTKGLIYPTYVMGPELVPPESAAKYGSKYILAYPGIKEDVYVSDFKPDPSIREELGIKENELVVTVRPPANEAHYHNPESEILFKATIEFLKKIQNLRMVVLPRNERQGLDIRNNWSELFANGKVLIPDHVVDGLNLIWYSDLVISGGGTMNREAAALGVPVYSIFRGKIGAIDQYLVNENRLTLIESVEDVRKKINLSTRNKSIKANITKKASLDIIVEEIVKIIENKD